MEQLAERVEVDTAVGVHHPLRPARGAAGVVDGDQVVLTRQVPEVSVRLSPGEELFIGWPWQARCRTGVDDVDDLAQFGELIMHWRDERAELGVDEQEARAAVLKNPG